MAKYTYTVDPVLSFNTFIEYKRQNLWIVYNDNIPAWVLSSAQRPTVDLGESRTFKYINTYEKLQHGNGEWKPISLTFNDPIVPSASEIVFNMLQRQWNYLDGFVGFKENYAIPKFEIRVLTPNTSIAESWILHNAFLTGVVDFNGAELTYDDFKQLQTKITLDYDYAELFTGGSPSLM